MSSDPGRAIGDEDDLTARVRDGGLLAAARPVVVMLSGGGTRSACSMSPSPWAAPAPSRRFTSTTDSATPPRPTSVIAGRCAIGWASNSPSRARAAGRSRGTSRPGRARRATARRPGSRPDGAPTSLPGTPPPTRSRRSCTGSHPRRAGARCWACGPARARLCARCWASRASRRRGTAPCAGSPGARTRATREPSSRAGGSATGSSPALREVHPGAERNVLALAGLLQAEAEVLDELVDDVLGGSR